MTVPSFSEATAVEPVDSHTYSADLSSDWCVGLVPHGGYVTATFMVVATRHFSTTLAKQKQPHTISLHLEFLRRTQIGTARFEVRDVKLGRQTSTIHLALKQEGREAVVGYITNSNIHTEAGLTLATNFELTPPPLPVDMAKLSDNTDKHWGLQDKMPFANFRKASERSKLYIPRDGQPHRSMNDEWITFRNGEKFTNESIGYVSDLWPQIVENYRLKNPYELRQEPKDEATMGPPRVSDKASFWYPTLLLNLDVKKALPPEGVEWLFVRVRSKAITNGRLDLEVIILDEAGDIVALSHHVSFILDVARNTAGRGKESGKSKI